VSIELEDGMGRTFNAVQGFGSIFGPLLGGLSAGFFGYGPAFATSVALVFAASGLLSAARIRDM